MNRLICASILSLSLALAGCSGDAEETPDISEAIPLDTDEIETDEGVANGADQADDYGAAEDSFAEGQAANGSDTPDLPGTSSGGRGLPDSMESGSNPPGMTEPPAGSKVQRIEG